MPNDTPINFLNTEIGTSTPTSILTQSNGSLNTAYTAGVVSLQELNLRKQQITDYSKKNGYFFTSLTSTFNNTSNILDTILIGLKNKIFFIDTISFQCGMDLEKAIQVTAWLAFYLDSTTYVRLVNKTKPSNNSILVENSETTLSFNNPLQLREGQKLSTGITGAGGTPVSLVQVNVLISGWIEDTSNL